VIATPPRVALALSLLAVCATPAQDPDVYTRTLKATALIAPPTGGGTGWVVDVDRRLLVTNEHVVAGHGEVAVIFPEYDPDGRPLAEPVQYGKARRIRAEVIDADGPRDLALLRLGERSPAGVTALKLADRDPRPAERVHSIGNPDASGALWVYSTGTVRQVYRKAWRYEDGPVRDARIVETQSPINAGDSGGPVVNDAGALIGVVSGRKADASLISWCIAASEVKNYLDEALPLVEPKTAGAFHRRGVRARDRGQLARAVDDLTAAHRLDPKSADIRVDRAAAYRARKEYNLALGELAAALALDPRHAGAHAVLGGIHLDHGRNDRALESLRKAIELDPKVAAFHADLGRAHANMGEFEPAVRSYDEAVRLSPTVADWYYRRGLALEQQGLAKKAEEDFARSVRLDPAYRERVTPHKARVLKVVNKTSHKVRVYLRYEGPNADGRLGWLPETLMWQFDPGEEAVLTYDGRQILARRMRIWADSLDSTDTWHAAMGEDAWAAPAAGYRGGAKPEVFTHTFDPKSDP
jgi:tetratricopeptide (TPR) repeat protein